MAKKQKDKKAASSKEGAGENVAETKAAKNSSSEKSTSKKQRANKSEAEQYLVLARKYRPTTFDEIIGQEVMVQTLKNAFETGRIAQAFMLTGVRGVGKTTTARILARALNYELEGGSREDPPQIEMPVYGKHCEGIMAGRHVDVIEMDAASNTGIDDIREIIEGARYKPVSSRYKVYIIDEVHMLSKSAFNGLLKTLEEPPPHVKFIFATTEIRKVPVTVLSRCQKFDLRRIPFDQLKAHYQKIAALEGAKFDEEATALIARHAAGSVRDGLSLLDQAIARSNEGQISADNVRDMLGLASFAHIIDLAKSCYSGDSQASLTQFDRLYGGGADPMQIMVDLSSLVHLMSRAKALKSTGTDNEETFDIDVSSEERNAIYEMADKLHMSVLTRSWQILLEGIKEIELAPQPELATQMLLLRLLYMADLPSPEELITHFEKQAKQSPDQPRPPTNGADQKKNDVTVVEQSRTQGTSQVKQDQARVEAFASSRTSPERPAGGAATAQKLQPQPEIDLDKLLDDEDSDEESAPSENLADQMPQVALYNFDDVIDLVGKKRDIRLKIDLEEAVELVSFEVGRIELYLRPDAPTQLPATLSDKLSRWTGMIWVVGLSRERGQEPVGAIRRQRKAEALAKIKGHPLVKATLEEFPGSEIIAIEDKDD